MVKILVQKPMLYPVLLYYYATWTTLMNHISTARLMDRGLWENDDRREETKNDKSLCNRINVFKRYIVNCKQIIFPIYFTLMKGQEIIKFNSICFSQIRHVRVESRQWLQYHILKRAYFWCLNELYKFSYLS